MTSLADVFIEVRPDSSHFSAELKSQLAKTREAVEVAAKLDTKALRPQLDALKAELRSLTVTKAKIAADATGATATIRMLKAQLGDLNKSIKLNADDTEAKAKIAEIKAQIATIQDAKAKMSIDSSAASAHIKALQAQLAVFDGKDYKANVGVNEKGINFAFRGISGLMTAIVGLAPIAVPALATVTAGVGVLGASLGAAAGAGAIWGGVMAGAMAAYKKDVTNLKALGKQLQTAQAAGDKAKAANIKQQMDVIKSGWSADEKEFDRLQEKFTGAFQAMVKASGPATFGVLNKGMHVLIDLFPRLVPIINGVGKAVGGLIDDFGRFAKTDRFQSLLDFFATAGPKAITSFGHIIGNLVVGVGNLIGAFAPFQGQFLDGFEKMTKKFSTWSAGFGKSGGFKDFMKYAKQVLPDVRDLFIQLTEFIGKFVVALGPLGGVELKILLSVLRGLNTLPPAALTAIAVGITGIVLALKAWELGTKAVSIAQKVATAYTWLFVGSTNAASGATKRAAVSVIGNWIKMGATATFNAIRMSAAWTVGIIQGSVRAIASMVRAAAVTAARWVFMGAQAMAQAARMAAAWIISMGPIALVIAAVVGVTVLVVKNWGTIKTATVRIWGDITAWVHKAWDNITKSFRDAMSWVGSTFKNSWAAVKGWVMTPINAARDLLKGVFGANGPVRTAFTNVKDWVGSTFKRAWSNITGWIMDPVNTVKDALKRVFGTGGPVRNAFNDVVGAVQTILAKIKGFTAKPINFVINTVLNNGLFKALGKLPLVPTWHANPIPGYDRGGYTGPGDRLRVAGVVHAREHVTKSESTESINRAAPGFLDALNKHGADALRYIRGYSQGGSVSGGGFGLNWGRAAAFAKSQVGQPYTWGGVGPHGYDCSGFMSAITNVLRGNPPHSRVGATASFPWPGFVRGPGEFTIGSTNNYGGSGIGHMAGTLRGMNVESRGGTGVITGPRARGWNDPGFNKHYHIGASGNFGTAGGGGGNPLDALNPKAWAKRLSGMAGGYGRLISGLPGHLVGKLGGWVGKKIRQAIGVVGDAFGGTSAQDAANAGAVPGGVRRWTSTALRALQGNGLPGTLLGAVLHRMNQESGGAPKIINTTDSNWTAGHPSVGLMQVIRGTYAKYKPSRGAKGPYEFGVSVDPYSNIYAGINYALHDPKYQGRSFYSVMMQKGGYDQGGIARGRGFMAKNIIEPERTLSPRQTESFERLVKLLEQGGLSASGTPLIAHADIHREVDLDKYEQQRAFRERVTNVGGF